MPLFSYFCNKCNKKEKRVVLANKRDEQECLICHDRLIRLGSSPSVQANETVDEYRGRSVSQDARRKVEDRAKEHFRRVDLPRIIEKEGKEFAIRQGWIDDEGNPK